MPGVVDCPVHPLVSGLRWARPLSRVWTPLFPHSGLSEVRAIGSSSEKRPRLRKLEARLRDTASDGQSRDRVTAQPPRLRPSVLTARWAKSCLGICGSPWARQRRASTLRRTGGGPGWGDKAPSGRRGPGSQEPGGGGFSATESWLLISEFRFGKDADDLCCVAWI